MYDAQHQDGIFMPDCSSSRIISHHFHVDRNEGDSGIVYDMIIGHKRMVQLGLVEYFKHQVLQLGGADVTMKFLSGLKGQKYLTGQEIHKVVM